MKEKKYWLGFNVFKGIGSRRFRLLYDYFGSAEKIWKAKERTLLSTGLPRNIVSGFVKFRGDFNLDNYLALLRKKEIKFLIFEDKDYPKNLKEIDSPPIVLYYRGEINKDDGLALGVVGTRRPTVYGKEVTSNLTQDLVGCGLTIVSGMARGIDSIAHRTAIKYGGRTIAVFACGVDVIYPPENRDLSLEIIKHGAVVSEYPVGTKPNLGSFPQRNRIISGLSLGVLVTEGAEHSGSLITARRAAEQGREVFAVPGPITSRMSAATARLLKDGAKLVRNVNDILEELKLERRLASRKHSGSGRMDSPRVKELAPEEQLLLEILRDGALHVDEISRKANLGIGRIAGLLTMMEIKGKVKSLGGGIYAVSHC